MKTQKINVIINESTPNEGQTVYHLNGNLLHKGEVVKCEKCKKCCLVNSFLIVSFPKNVKTIEVFSKITTDELYYNEESESCLCSDCG